MVFTYITLFKMNGNKFNVTHFFTVINYNYNYKRPEFCSRLQTANKYNFLPGYSAQVLCNFGP